MIVLRHSIPQNEDEGMRGVFRLLTEMTENWRSVAVGGSVEPS
jgi:hypothetical protein